MGEKLIDLTIIILLALNIIFFWDTRQLNQGVTPILRLYNDAIVQCKDDACRQYMTMFYVRTLRELNNEQKEIKGATK